MFNEYCLFLFAKLQKNLYTAISVRQYNCIDKPQRNRARRLSTLDEATPRLNISTPADYGYSNSTLLTAKKRQNIVKNAAKLTLISSISLDVTWAVPGKKAYAALPTIRRAAFSNAVSVRRNRR